MKKLTSENRRIIIDLIGNGYKAKDIATRFNITQPYVRQIIKEYCKYGESAFIVKDSGRKNKSETKLSLEQEQIKKLEAEVSELKEIIEIREKLNAFVEEARMKKGK